MYPEPGCTQGQHEPRVHPVSGCRLARGLRALREPRRSVPGSCVHLDRCAYMFASRVHLVVLKGILYRFAWTPWWRPAGLSLRLRKPKSPQDLSTIFGGCPGPLFPGVFLALRGTIMPPWPALLGGLARPCRVRRPPYLRNRVYSLNSILIRGLSGGCPPRCCPPRRYLSTGLGLMAPIPVPPVLGRCSSS